MKGVAIDAAEAWSRAGDKLEVRLTAPFVFVANGRRYDCVALVPDFGGGLGTLVMETRPPLFETDALFAKDAEDSGYRWSFVNQEVYAALDDDLLRETLLEWGFSGPPEYRPRWLGASP